MRALLQSQPPYAVLVAALAAVSAFGLVGLARPATHDAQGPGGVLDATRSAVTKTPVAKEIDLTKVPAVATAGHASRVQRVASKSPDSSASVMRMIGQKLMAAVEPTGPTALLFSRIERGELGGVILMGEWSPARARSVTDALRRAAQRGGQPPLLVATDQEGGAVRRIAGHPVLSPAEMGAEGPGAARRQGALAAETLAAAGVNVDLAPVADVTAGHSFLGSRAFGSSSAQVAAAASSFAEGLQDGGIAATAKHFPGLGATGAANTDTAVVHSPAFQLAPFRSLIGHSVSLVMVSNAIYRSLDPTHPAILSRRIVTGLLRKTLGFRGVVISDEMHTPAVQAFGRDAPGDAVNAGADILLYANSDGVPAWQALLADVHSGRVSVATLRASYRRLIALKRRLSSNDLSQPGAGSAHAPVGTLRVVKGNPALPPGD